MIGREQPPPLSNSRSKRAPFSFVGDLANSLFDVATVSDVKKLKQHVDKLYSMQLRKTILLHENRQWTDEQPDGHHRNSTF